MNKIIVQSPAPNYKNSKNYYKLAGFKTLKDGEKEMYVGDGSLILKINSDPSARLGICLYTERYKDILNNLLGGKPLEIENGHLLQDPNGVRVYLYPLEICPTEIVGLEHPKSHFGNFAGIGIESVHYNATMIFYHTLGYMLTTGDIDKDKYATMTLDGGPALTIYQPGICPHAFYNPSLTYFNGKENNPRVIDFIRSNHLSIVEEITAFNNQGLVDNIIVRDPGGLHVFLFND